MRTDRQPPKPAAPSRTANAHPAADPCFKHPLPFPFPFLLAAALILFPAAAQVRAQTPAGPAPAPATTSDPAASDVKPAHHHQRPSAAKPLNVPLQAAPEPVTAPVPEKPKWPAFDSPSPASVVWDSHGLSIEATNSSLEQILKDVSTATGAKVDGLAGDQRVFGAYGPGQARDVLSQLLLGSGYNVIMIGDQGQGAPKQILLSMRQASGAQPVVKSNAGNNEEDDVDEPPPPQEPGPMRPGFPPGAAPRTPQQIEQEMEQRREQMQQQTQPQPQPQQQPPVNPQN
ncbi:MAG TPA: hypothetical protein VMQ56_13705 [Terracidiphilus sp.]|nr:hypothetical protein [Terracidiphilus sp.]